MGEVIYWKPESKLSIGDYCPLPGDWKCKDKRVKMFRIWGSSNEFSDKAIIGSSRGHIYFKNGTEWMTKQYKFSSKTMEKVSEKIITQAENYLKQYI